MSRLATDSYITGGERDDIDINYRYLGNRWRKGQY